MRLQSIVKEAADCRAAWAAMPEAKAGMHIHHEIVAEELSEPIEARIAYILAEKPKKEQALRLRLMRPVKAAALAEYQRIKAAAHRAICPTPDCPYAQREHLRRCGVTTIDLDEIETNATTAALFERRTRLAAAVKRLEGQPQTDDQAFALACNRQAIRHTEMALHRISGSLPDLPEPPDPIDEYKAWTESELREAFA